MTWAMRLNGGQLMDDGAGVHYPGIGGNGWTINVIADGTTFGTLEPLVKTMNTLMTSGQWETLGAPGNRSPALILEVEGDTPDGLNAGEVWLSALMGRGALEWLPPSQTVPTLFDVIWSYIDRTMDARWDLDDAAWVRYYRIPIKALSYARSPELTVTPAVPATAITDIVVNDGSSATGWSGSRVPSTGTAYDAGTAISASVVSGAVRATVSSGTGTMFVEYTLPSAIPAATPYLQIDLRWSGGDWRTYYTQAKVGGVWVDMSPARYITTATRQVTAYCLVPDGATAVRVGNNLYFSASNPYIEVDQIRRQSRLPDAGTGRQRSLTIYPGGSAPAEGSLHVGNTVALGKTIVYTFPIGRPSPALRQYRTAGNTPTPDTSAINGDRTQINSVDMVLTVPDAQLPTRGRAALWGKFQVDTAVATVRWTITPTLNGSAVGQAQTRDVLLPVGTTVLVPLGLVTLPGAVTGPTGSHVVTLRRVSGTGTLSVDEVWAFGMDEDSALTIVDAGTGTPTAGAAANNLWINAPTPEKPAGEVLIGTGLDDARWPSIIHAGPQVHTFPPSGVSVQTATCAAANSTTDLTHYKRWTHHAAEAS